MKTKEDTEKLIKECVYQITGKECKDTQGFEYQIIEYYMNISFKKGVESLRKIVIDKGVFNNEEHRLNVGVDDGGFYMYYCKNGEYIEIKDAINIIKNKTKEE